MKTDARTRSSSVAGIALASLCCCLAVAAPRADAQTLPPKSASEQEVEVEEPPPWYARWNVRGYLQLRHNGLPTLASNARLVNAQGDRSIGDGGGFLIRRARLVLAGDVHEQLAVYLQSDFASSIGEQGGVAIVRDWYADIFLSTDRQLRLRVGQSKVPFGFENLQSSQNRLPLDRADGLNTAFKDERDIGAILYWAPPAVRVLFKSLVDRGLKGSGDYGVVGLGVVNGQAANRFDTNGNLHVVGRITWPFHLGDQVVEIGGGGYVGKYRVTLVDAGGDSYTTDDPTNDLLDRRIFATLVLYPQPLGLVAEYNYGEGPSQGQGDPARITSRLAHGGYIQAMLNLGGPLGTVALMPYVRGQYYRGGKKFEVNAPRYEIDELEIGLEWQVITAVEVVAAYVVADRTSSRAPYLQEAGHIGRMQLQVNY